MEKTKINPKQTNKNNPKQKKVT